MTMTMLGSIWFLRLLLLLLPFVPLPSIGAARTKKISAMLQEWRSPKYKEIKVPRDAKDIFCRTDDVAPRYDSPLVRKEYHTLTDEERTTFHECLKCMKYKAFVGNSGISKYDMYVMNHRNASAPGAHAGPAFLGFHREYCERFEKDLNECNSKCFLPFWDSSLEANLPDPSHSVFFDEYHMGNGFGVVDNGFMGHWKVATQDCQEDGMEVRRECGNDGSLLMTDEKVERFLNQKSYEEAVTPFNSDFEEAHGEVHTYCGGHMMSLTCAPNDPIFWLHHCYIDYVYEQFRKKHPASCKPEAYPVDPAVPQYHDKNDPMLPFYDKKNVDGLSNDYTQLAYTYEPSPKKCDTDGKCPSKDLWCDSKQRCNSKVVEGGDCTGLPDKACHCRGEGQTPKCVTAEEMGKCQCNKGTSHGEGSSTTCVTPKDCHEDMYCDKRTGSCLKKVPLNGDCTGLPRTACSGICDLPRMIHCVNGKFACVTQRCESDDKECLSPALWCDTHKKRCLMKPKIGH